jgi:hypothetical protein
MLDQSVVPLCSWARGLRSIGDPAGKGSTRQRWQVAILRLTAMPPSNSIGTRDDPKSSELCVLSGLGALHHVLQLLLEHGADAR